MRTPLVFRMELNANPPCVPNGIKCEPPLCSPLVMGENTEEKNSSPLIRGDARRAEGFEFNSGEGQRGSNLILAKGRGAQIQHSPK